MDHVYGNDFPSYIFLMLPFNSTLLGNQQNGTQYRGYVREAGSGELLIGVNIYLSDHRTGTITNNYGFFSLTLQESDTIEITASYIGFRSETRRLAFTGNTS